MKKNKYRISKISSKQFAIDWETNQEIKLFWECILIKPLANPSGILYYMDYKYEA